MLRQGQIEAVRQGGFSPRLLPFAIAITCLLVFFSAPSSSSAQRLLRDQTLAPLVETAEQTSDTVQKVRPEFRKAQSLLKAKVIRLSAQGDLIVPHQSGLKTPQPGYALVLPQPVMISMRLKVAALTARGPPA